MNARFAIRQTRINHVTGEKVDSTLPKVWKTRRGAEQFGNRFCSWIVRPRGQRVTESSDFQILEVPL